MILNHTHHARPTKDLERRIEGHFVPTIDLKRHCPANRIVLNLRAQREGRAGPLRQQVSKMMRVPEEVIRRRSDVDHCRD